MSLMRNEIQESISSTVENKEQPKLVYLDVAGRMHSLYNMFLLSPPPGYRFVTAASNWDNISMSASRMNVIYSLQLNVLSRLIPPNLFKAYLERFKKAPSKAALTYSVGHLVFRKEPWVVDMEFVTQLTGYKYHHLRRFKRLVEKVLGSDYCRKIICWTGKGAKTVLLNLNCAAFADKIEVVPLSASKKDFAKEYNDEKVRLLFVGSVNIPGEFEYKGGKEVLEAFFILRKKYKNIELVVRSDVRDDLKALYSKKLRGVQLIEGMVPWEQLEREFKMADIFLFPSYSTPGLAILDAMSYELPVVTTNVWANSEMVEDGKTGFVINKSKRIQYYTGNFIPNWSHYPTSKFMRIIRETDPAVVNELVQKTSILIENEGLRRRMGKMGRQEVEEGKFSELKRRKALKRILDEAVAN
jgi:glycosyltransferase involved in cell wall biosynthesis